MKLLFILSIGFFSTVLGKTIIAPCKAPCHSTYCRDELESTSGIKSHCNPHIPPPMEIRKTLIVVILDESGSMSVQKNDVIGGYNSFLESQREITDDQARLVLIKFSTKVHVAHGALSIKEAPKLNAFSYRPSGGTALYDAVAEGIRVTEATVQSDERVLVLIMTDGEENMSKKSTASEVKKMISNKESLGTWTFAYIGENPEGWAKTMAQPVLNVRKYDMDHQGSNMEKANEAVTNFRGQAAPQSAKFFATA